MMGILDTIVKTTKHRIKNLDSVNYKKLNLKKKKRSLSEAIIKCDRAAVITEIKPASPTSGVMIENINVENIAKNMESGGAIGLSVLTEPIYFKGSYENLLIAKQSTELPILMKDFIIDDIQLEKAVEIGADVVLLMPSITEVQHLYERALDLGLEVLFETHNRKQVDQALKLEAKLIGVNNRDLQTFTINLDRTVELIPYINDLGGNSLIISESGISKPEHIKYLYGKGANAFLVGTSVIKSDDIEKKVMSLVDAIK